MSPNALQIHEEKSNKYFIFNVINITILMSYKLLQKTFSSKALRQKSRPVSLEGFNVLEKIYKYQMVLKRWALPVIIFAFIIFIRCKDSATQVTEYLQVESPVLVSPKANSEQFAPVTLKWGASKNADSFQFRLSKREDFKTIFIDSVVNTSKVKLERLPSGTAIYWKVRANDHDKKDQWSKTNSFTVANSQNIKHSVSTDRQVLMDLYKATDGETWTNNKNWETDQPLADWYGIETNSQGRVTRIDLWHNNLRGNIESVPWSNLKEVKYLNLKYNHLIGQIPSSLGGMTNLEVLILQGRSQSRSGGNYVIGGRLKEPPLDNWIKSYHQGKYYSNTNNFSGQIPPELGNLSNLIALEISNAKKIVGPIPSELGNLSNLEGLYLSGCDFRGYEIPSSIGNLTNLKQIYIEGAGLTGRLPNSFQNLTQLTQVNLGGFDKHTDDIMGNQLTGSIPDLSNFTEIRLLVINKNNLTGKFPDYFNNGNFIHMHTLSLSHNNLTGKIPHFTNLPNLWVFSVEYNNMTGDVSRLQELDSGIKIMSIGWNNIGGTFPESGWPDYYQLKTVRFNSNPISGNIPCSFWQKLNNSKLKVCLFGSMPNINDACPSTVKAMEGDGSIRMSLP